MSEDYQSILRRNVGPSVRKLGLRLRSWVLQQDNDPNHTSKAPQNGLRQSTGEFWRPAMSPNLNPIELIWRYLRTAVGRRNSSNLKDLEQLAKEEWSKIPKTHNGYRRQLISVFFFFFSKSVLPDIKLRVPIILSSPSSQFCVECPRFGFFPLCYFNENKINETTKAFVLTTIFSHTHTVL